MGAKPMAKAPLAQTSLGLCPGRQTKGLQACAPPIAGGPSPQKRLPLLRKYTVDQEKGIEVGALTGLQGGQWFRLLAELAVPNVIGCLHAKLVGRERLEPRGG